MNERNAETARAAEPLQGVETLHGTSLLQRDGLTLALYFALTLIMTNPLVLHLAQAVEDTQDALLNTWIIAWVGHALVTDPSSLFHANIFYPYPNTLAFSETLLPQALVALPLNLAFHNTALGHNLVLLFSFFLAAYAMYLLVLDLTHARGAALIAGIIFAFNPYDLGNLAQVQLLSLGWLPLSMLFLRRMLSQSERTDGPGLQVRDLTSALVFALLFSLQALSSMYYALLAGIAVGLYVVWFLAQKWLHREQVSVLRLLSQTVVSAVVIVILVVPILTPYLTVQREMGFVRKIQESEQFSASLKLYTEVSPQNVLYGTWLAPRPPIVAGGYPLDHLFPGLVAVALAAIGLVTSGRRERWLYGLLLAIAFVLSLGPRLYLTPSLAADVPLPYRWLYDALPFLQALRAPVRFNALVMFALAVLAGFGSQRLEVGSWKPEQSGQWAADSEQKAEGGRQKAAGRRFPSSFIPHPSSFANLLHPSSFRVLPTAFCLLLIVFEYLAVPAASIAPVVSGDQAPAYVRWLAQQPPTTILELPMMAREADERLDLTTQYLSTYHWQRTPDGYSGFNPRPRGAIAYEMQFLPGARAISLLQALDVEYLVVHSAAFADWPARRAAFERAPGVQLVRQFGEDYVYRVPAAVPTSGTLEARVYLPSPAAPGQNYLAFLVVLNRGERSFAIKPTEALHVEAHWSGATTVDQRVKAALPLVTSSASVVPVLLRAPAQVGAYQLNLRVSGRGVGEVDLRGEVSVRDEEPAHQVVLPARVRVSSPARSEYARGDMIEIGLAWEPLNKIDAYYSASVRVVDAKGNKVVNVDREPATQTMFWVPEVSVSDHFVLMLPRDLAPGEYSLQLLMYQANDGTEALLLDDHFEPRESFVLGGFVVK